MLLLCWLFVDYHIILFIILIIMFKPKNYIAKDGRSLKTDLKSFRKK